jgi:hypothetical protein
MWQSSTFENTPWTSNGAEAFLRFCLSSDAGALSVTVVDSSAEKVHFSAMEAYFNVSNWVPIKG